MYFLIIRPQQKRAKEHREMISAVRRGDVVVTSGGLIGKVVRVVGDNEVRIEIADGIQVRAVKSTLAEVRTKSEPARDRGRPEPEPDNDDEEFEDEDSDAPEDRRSRNLGQAARQMFNDRKNKGRNRPKNKNQSFTGKAGAQPHPPAGVMTSDEALEEAELNAVAREVEAQAETDVQAVEDEMKRGKDKRGA
jgi:preprotein translocase subunit YajC